MKRVTRALSIFTIVMLALALMPVGSVFAAAPATTLVTVTPNPVAVNATATVKATITAEVGLTVTSAFYNLNGTGDVAFTGTLGAESVIVSATFTAAKLGPNQVCVHGVDSASAAGDPVCADFTVEDTLPPLVSNVKVTAVMTSMTGTATVTATIDDSTTGGSTIASAFYTLNGGAPVAMMAVDTIFDQVSEAVTGIVPSISAGANTLCVSGTDLPGNPATPVCTTFTLYAFKGFLSPIKMGVTNSANAPQTIPIKWWLTDAAGKSVSKATVFSTIKVMSYQVDCTTKTGDATKATAVGSPGKTGLKYLGSGRWQINWKTEKSFKGTCRKMFVQFNSVQSSPEVVFAFKK
jgi:hypothetical protein